MYYDDLYKNAYMLYRNNNNDITNFVLDTKYGDVTGDGTIDKVFVTGDKRFGDELEYFSNLQLHIETESSTEIVDLPYNAGYNTTLFLGPFDQTMIDRILVITSLGSTGGDKYAFVYSYRDNKLKVLFDSIAYNQQLEYDVNYENFYKVKVSDFKDDEFFIIDLTAKNDSYLRKIYDKDGILKEPKRGFVGAVVEVFPVDLFNTGIYQLSIFQNVYGISGADVLGFLSSYKFLNNEEFQRYSRVLSIFPSKESNS